MDTQKVIDAGKWWAILIDGVLHGVDKQTKLCNCGMACNAAAAVEDHFASRKARNCQVCGSATVPHPRYNNDRLCTVDPTHYWIHRSEMNRARWVLLDKLGPGYTHDVVMGIRPREPIEKKGQAVTAADGESDVPPVPEAEGHRPARDRVPVHGGLQVSPAQRGVG